MNDGSFVLYESVYKQSERLEKKLGAEAAYRFIKAVMEFGLYGVIPEEEDNVWLYGLEQTITSIDKAKDRYTAAVANGKKGGRPKTIDDSKIKELIDQGKTNKEIADMLGCSISSVEKKGAQYRKNRKNLNENENDNVNENDNMNVFPSSSPSGGIDLDF